ncbi:filamentous hemagglutinin N-terminal domain-containing protein, partial [Campylobacter sp. IFREMER_LSEM_CL292]|uniref:filamentous hemagglutinin N-terminal domain-containing protein n=1 Tax=Campylobacter sp. IFREMER_LSEM_CL292 TaxID=2911623 RepID=UPI0021E871FE
MIEGLLNAKGNNVFLINPNGVIITKTGTINANRFVASTSSLNENDYKNFFSKGAAFSPVFKPNPKGGNVINMGGEINAASVVLQGNKVVSNAYADYDKNLGEHSKQISANEITLQGNEVYVDVSSINGNKLSKLNIKGGNGNNFEGSMYLNASGYYYNPSSFKVFNKFNNSSSNFKVYKYVGIGSDVDWWHFAKGWNENAFKDSEFRKNANEYRLTNDIDFKASNGQNYANYWVDLNGDGKRQDNEFTNMMIGYHVRLVEDSEDYNSYLEFNSFKNKIFDGQGFALKNINMDLDNVDTGSFILYKRLGLFGTIEDSSFKNIHIDYENGGIKYHNDFYDVSIGGLVGVVKNSNFDNIRISNLNSIDIRYVSDYYWMANYLRVGGLAGVIEGDKKQTFSNIKFDNIFGDVFIKHGADYTDVGIYSKTYLGGLAGYIKSKDASFSNIMIGYDKNHNINTESVLSHIYRGGFAGYIGGGLYKNIGINFYGDSNNNGFAGIIADGDISLVQINNKKGRLDNIFSSYIDGGSIHDLKLENLKARYSTFGTRTNMFTDSEIFFNNIILDEIEFKSNGSKSGFGNFGENSTADNVKLSNIKFIGDGGSGYNSASGFGSIGKSNNIIMNQISFINNDSASGFGAGGGNNVLMKNFNFVNNKEAAYFCTDCFYGANKISFSDFKFNNKNKDYKIYGFARTINYGKYENINLNLAYHDINGGKYAGGFAGYIDNGTFNNINLTVNGDIISTENNSEYVRGSYTGGFAGYIDNGTFNNINLTVNGDIISTENNSEYTRGSYAGGFAGAAGPRFDHYGDETLLFKNINLNINGDISSTSLKNDSYAGGFVGESGLSHRYEKISIKVNSNSKISSITKDPIDYSQSSSYVGGFAGLIGGSNELKDISLNINGDISSTSLKNDSYAGGFVGNMWGKSNFDTINLAFNGSISSTATNGDAYAGGFVGRDENYQSVYENIVVKGDKLEITSIADKNSYAGGFAGTSTSNFNNIVIDVKSDISSTATNGDAYAGGFVGGQKYGGGGIYDKIKVNNISSIESVTHSKSNGDAYAGGFAGQGVGNFSNISLDNIGIISSSLINVSRNGGNSYVGGFAGKIWDNKKVSNISLKKLGDISSCIKGNEANIAYVGGFAGNAWFNTINNISIDGIESITNTIDNKNNPISYIGGFIGYANQLNLNNISIKKIGKIENINKKISSKDNIIVVGENYTSGFIGSISDHLGGSKGYLKANNVFIFLDENFKIQSDYDDKINSLESLWKGKFIVGGIDKIKELGNIHVYHSVALDGKFADEYIWNIVNGNNVVDKGKVNIHAYMDKNLALGEFNNLDKLVLRPILPIITPPSNVTIPQIPEVNIPDFEVDNPNIAISDLPQKPITNIPDVEDIKNETAILSDDDILDPKLLEKIISDLKDKFYAVDINTLNDLLKAYAKIDKDNPTSKAEFLANYLLSKDKYPNDDKRLDIAHSMIQSLDFLLAYQDNGLDKASDDKFADNEAIQTKDNILAEVSNASNQANINKDKVNNFIQTTLKDKVN